jgi:hypothetical protein
MLSAVVPKDDDARARQFIDDVRHADDSAAKAMLDSSLPEDKVDAALSQIEAMLPKGDLLSVELVGCNVTLTSGRRVDELSYQLHFPGAWLVANFVLKSQDGATMISGFHLTPMTDSLANINRFGLIGKPQLNYFVLACCVAFPILTLAALVLCLRSKVRRKWLWIVFILLGVMKFSLNWTTGACSLNSLSVVLLSSGCFSPGVYGPWTLYFGLPLGAVFFLVSRRKLAIPPVRAALEKPSEPL